jgi:hypothetical protein
MAEIVTVTNIKSAFSYSAFSRLMVQVMHAARIEMHVPMVACFMAFRIV